MPKNLDGKVVVITKIGRYSAHYGTRRYIEGRKVTLVHARKCDSWYRGSFYARDMSIYCSHSRFVPWKRSLDDISGLEESNEEQG